MRSSVNSEPTPAESVLKILMERGQTLALAESCTGGLLSAQITAFPGVSACYLGSLVAYSNRIKEQWLHVPGPLLQSMGAVSLPVARCMATGARAAFRSAWGLSITGIAGPGGGSLRKPVGTVCFGIAGPGVEEAEQALFTGDRTQIQAASAEFALRLLFRHLS